MKFITSKNEKGEYIIPKESLTETSGGYKGEAAELLALYENLYNDKIKEQEIISAELQKLRADGKDKSYKFRELMGKKLANGYVIQSIEELHSK